MDRLLNRYCLHLNKVSERVLLRFGNKYPSFKSSTECEGLSPLCSSVCLDRDHLLGNEDLTLPFAFPDSQASLQHPPPEAGGRVFGSGESGLQRPGVGLAAVLAALHICFFAQIKVNVEGRLSWRAACRGPAKFNCWG